MTSFILRSKQVKGKAIRRQRKKGRLGSKRMPVPAGPSLSPTNSIPPRFQSPARGGSATTACRLGLAGEAESVLGTQVDTAASERVATPILSLVNKNAIAGEIVLAATSPLW